MVELLETIKLTQHTLQDCYEFLGIANKGNFPETGFGIDPEDGQFKVTHKDGKVTFVNIDDIIGRDENGEIHVIQKTFLVPPFGLIPRRPVLTGVWSQDLINNRDYYAQVINDVVSLCAGIAKESGWDEKQREMGTKLCLVHSEVSEAMEGYRKDLMDDHLPHRKMFEVELGDAVIRIGHISGEQNLDLGYSIVEKLEYNTKREDHKPENRAKENGKKF